MRSDIDIEFREVGLRDGLQNVNGFFPTAAKIQWLQREIEAGMPAIEVCSFVPPKLIPQFQDALEVVAAAHAGTNDGCVIAALIPNLKGAERGVEAGLKKLNYVTSVSETHNMKNVRRSPAESVEDFKRIVALRDSLPAGTKFVLEGGLATSFGCTLEGRIDPGAVVRLAEQYLEAGADQLTVADTVGYANPQQVRDLFKLLKSHVGNDVFMTAHFHDTRGLALANIVAAIETGVVSFDACLAGLGGCPWAPGATGNAIMEDAVFMCEAMGLRTGVDLDRLCSIREIIVANLPGEPLHGAIAKAGAPKGYTPATRFAAAAE